MKELDFEERTEKLRCSIARSQGDLDLAVTQLKHVSREAVSMGRWMASAPWNWLLIAGVAGVFMGLRRRSG
jgi:hypothetical protein